MDRRGARGVPPTRPVAAAGRRLPPDPRRVGPLGGHPDPRRLCPGPPELPDLRVACREREHRPDDLGGRAPPGRGDVTSAMSVVGSMFSPFTFVFFTPAGL